MMWEGRREASHMVQHEGRTGAAPCRLNPGPVTYRLGTNCGAFISWTVNEVVVRIEKTKPVHWAGT